MITTTLCYAATLGSSVADFGTPCRVDMGYVGSISSSHTPSKGSGRVRHLCSCFVSDGHDPRCHFRADRTLIPAMADAVS